MNGSAAGGAGGGSFFFSLQLFMLQITHLERESVYYVA